MYKVKEILIFNASTLGISLTEIEQYLQIALLVLSTIVTLIATIKKSLPKKDEM